MSSITDHKCDCCGVQFPEDQPGAVFIDRGRTVADNAKGGDVTNLNDRSWCRNCTIEPLDVLLRAKP